MGEIVGDREELTRRVPTRWNSDLACIDSCVHFRKAVVSLTEDTAHKLGAYRMTNTQWDLALELVGALTVSVMYSFTTVAKQFLRIDI